MRNELRMRSEFKILCLLQLHESINNKFTGQTATESILRLLLTGELKERCNISLCER